MDPMGYDSSLFLGGKPFFSGNSLKAQFWIPTNFDFDVKSPTEKHTQQIWNWPDLSTTKVSTFEISHGASNSQLSTLKIPERNSKFSVGQQCFHVFRCPSESSIRSRIFPKGDWGGKPSWSTPEENGVFVFLGWKAKTRKFDEIHVCCFIWLYLQYTYTCWYPVVGFFCDKCRRIYHIWIWCILNSRQ